MTRDGEARADGGGDGARGGEEHIALFSGGHDSLVSTHYTLKNYDEVNEVVHIDTGFGVPETREFVEEVADGYGWNLTIQKTQHSYEEKVKEYGFPGPSAHLYMYVWLKERPLARLKRERDADDIHLYTGARRHESRNRMGRVEEVDEGDKFVWHAPSHDWRDSQIGRYMEEHDLPENPVVKRTSIGSGECLCGAYGNRDEELAELEKHYPETAERIKNLEERVQEEQGTDEPTSWWGHASMSATSLRAKTIDDRQARLCVGCKAQTTDESGEAPDEDNSDIVQTEVTN